VGVGERKIQSNALYNIGCQRSVIREAISDGTTIVHPQHEMLLAAGDTVILMGHRGDIPQFAQKYVLRRDIRYRGARG
jgi:voltage-gated potassium channel